MTPLLIKCGTGKNNLVARLPNSFAAWAHRLIGIANVSLWMKAYQKRFKKLFVRLYDDELIYRGKRLVNWDPKLHTAISDLEVENKEKQGHMWHFRYPLAQGALTADGKDYLEVATTRPETMLGDSAVAVHPDDERYQSLIGKFILLPIVNRLVPIVADDYVDMEFGTGCVKITPAP